MPMVHAIRVYATGGPDVLKWEEIDLPPPGPGQVRVVHKAVGLNFVDTYFRSGLYPMNLPSGLGMEGAGEVVELGDGVTSLKPGDRIAYGTGPLGAYSEAANLPADRVTKLPAEISDEVAAAMMLKGMTVQYLLKQTYQVKPGEAILVHAAAGGVGLILCQWAKHLGATIIGTVGSAEKAALAKAHGCDHTILYREEKIVPRVRELTGGKGVPVVYDSVGKDTFEDSLNCLQPRGLMVSFGNASGPVPAFEPAILGTKGSLYLTRATLASYTATAEDLAATAGDVVQVVRDGIVKIEVNQRYPLRDAAQAHRDLEGRKTTGSTVLLP
jgi:NADPH2:quinone reductase